MEDATCDAARNLSMDTVIETDDFEQDGFNEVGQDGFLATEQYILDVGYLIEGSCMAFGGFSPTLQTSDTAMGLSSNECEIDITPEYQNSERKRMAVSPTPENLIEALKDDNASLLERVTYLQRELAELQNRETGSATLPTLYERFVDATKRVEELEKRNQELEDEVRELSQRVDKHEPSTPVNAVAATTNEGASGSGGGPSQMLKRAVTFPCSHASSMPRQAVPCIHEAPSQLPDDEKEDFEAMKLEMAERIVKQEDKIHELESQREQCLDELNHLRVGVDGLEFRFDQEIKNVEIQGAQRYESLQKELLQSRANEAQIGKDMERIQREMHRLWNSLPMKLEEMDDRFRDEVAEKNREIQGLKDVLESRTMNLEEAKKQITAFSVETDSMKTYTMELQSTIQELECKVASIRTQRLVPDGLLESPFASQEKEAMQAHIEQLENRLLEITKEAFLRESEQANEAIFSVTAVADDHSQDELRKENKELRSELMEVSQKLVCLEEHNESLKEEIDNQSDFFGQCLNLEEELEAQRRVNRGLDEHLSRRKKRIDALQNELGALQQKLTDRESGFGDWRHTNQSTDRVTHHVDDMIQHERRYEELDRILNAVQAERDELLRSKAHLNKMMHSLIKENKVATRGLNKLKKEGHVMEEKLAEVQADNTKLTARLKVEALTRQHSGRSYAASEAEEDIMSKLVSSQIALAEMDERMIKLRKELHRSVAKNAYLSSKVSQLEQQSLGLLV